MITQVSSETITGLAVEGATVEVFLDSEDEGRVFLGSTAVDEHAAFSLSSEQINGSFITATITDSSGSTSPFSSPVTRSPSANAGTNQTITRGGIIILDGSSSSDPDEDPLTYYWTQSSGPEVELDSNNSVSPSFTAPDVSVDSTITFKLTVHDGYTSSSTSSVEVFIPGSSGQASGSSSGGGCGTIVQGLGRNIPPSASLITLIGGIGMILAWSLLLRQRQRSLARMVQYNSGGRPLFLTPQAVESLMA